MKKQYHVNLTKEERNHLIHMLMGGTRKVREIKRIQISLKADDGWIADAHHVGRATVERPRKRFSEEGLKAALHDKKRNPVVCLDETNKQLIAEIRTSLPMEPGASLLRFRI